MDHLGEILKRDCDLIVQRWCEAWRDTDDSNLSDTDLKDSFALQLATIGEHLSDEDGVRSARRLWTVAARLDPEARVRQDMPIEQMVQSYMVMVVTVREWIAEHALEVSFEHFSYFYQAIFELVAESVRRYSEYQRQQVRQDRAEYLAGVAHQMRTPLSTLSMNLHMLEIDNRRAAELLPKMQRSVRRLTGLTNGVMRLERFKPGQLPVRPRPLYPADLIDQVVDDRRTEASHKRLRLETRIDRALEMCIDPDLFLDTFGNLIDNAIKHTPSGTILVDVSDSPDSVLFKVRDSGHGIAPDRQKALFEPVEPTDQGGAGIGLLVAHRAVLAQGGTMGVESAPEAGSCFWFRLPKQVGASMDSG